MSDKVVMRGKPHHTYDTRGRSYKTGADGLIENPDQNDRIDLLSSGCEFHDEPKQSETIKIEVEEASPIPANASEE